MRALPFGFPKLMVSTVASGDTKPYVETKDICMMPSVVDIAGLNHVSRRILSNAAGAICGMVASEEAGALEEKPAIAATMFGVTTPCVTSRAADARAGRVRSPGLSRHRRRRPSDGAVDRRRRISGVLDMTTTELADELVGGVMSAGPHRLEAAGRKGIPQLVCPGAIDMVNFGPAGDGAGPSSGTAICTSTIPP